ncbi:MAG: hypothetical protein PWR30_464 [Candidatus Woesearchaeota archaeon]|nr:hypothetical protein [Candidatus Woesearchaeota archaeon]
MEIEKEYLIITGIVVILLLIAFTINLSMENAITGFYTLQECEAMCTGNTQPYISPSFPRTYNLLEEEEYVIEIIGNDTEGDDIYYTTDESKGTWDSLFLYPNGTMNITPTNDDVGRKSIFIIPLDICSDPDECAQTPDLTTSAITFYIENVNDLPFVVEANPEAGSGFTGAENHSLSFNVTIADDDYSIADEYYNESFNYSFILDGAINYSETLVKSLEFNWTYEPGWYDAGEHNVTFLVYDYEGANASYEWIFYVNNTNRIPLQNATLPNITWEEDTNSTPLLLNYYFYDLDLDDVLNYSVNVSSGINYSVYQDEGMSYIKFIPLKDWFGNQTVVMNVSDGYDFILSNQFILNVTNVNDPPIIEEIPDLSTASGYLFEYPVNATDPDNDAIEYGLFGNPSWLSISEYGIINGTPPVGEEGTYIFNVSAMDPYSAYSLEEVKLNVFYDQPPVFDDIEHINTTEWNLTRINVSVRDPDGDSFEVISDFNYALYKFNDTLYYYNFTPKQIDVGEHVVRLNATDSWGLKSTYSFNLTVLDKNFPPELDEVGDQVAKIGKAYFFDINATDPDDDPLYYDINLSFVSIDHSTGIITYSGSSEHEGTYVANVSVEDPAGEVDYELINFTVTYNRPPDLEELGYFEIEEDVEWIKQIKATDPDNDELSFEANASIGLNSSTGLINYTPPLPGLFHYNITVHDEDMAFDSSLLILNVTPFNDPPYINTSNLNITTMEENETIIYVEYFDEEGAEIILYDNTTDFDFIKINNTLGKINYTPMEQGNYSYLLIASDGDKNGTAVLNVSVLPYNHPPELYSYSPSLFVPAVERDVLNFSVVVHDPDGDELTFRWKFDDVELDNNKENLSYTLGWYDAGTHELRLEITDAFNQPANSTPLSWYLVVEDLNRPPVYGKRVFDNFSSGTFDNCVNGSLKLLNDSDGLYPLSGTYITPRIDFFDEGFIHFDRIEAAVNLTSKTNISFEYKKSLNNPPIEFADTIMWGSWQPIPLTYQDANHSTFTFNGSNIQNVTENSKYFQFRITLNTTERTETPILHNFTLYYNIAETSIDQGSYGNRWITPENFFIEHDLDNELSYSATSEYGKVVAYFPEGLSYAKIEPINDEFVGEDFITVSASDGIASVSSDPVKINVVKKNTTGLTTQYLIQTRTETVTRFVPKTEEVPVYEEFNLLVPESMTLYENDTVIVPILLDNSGNDTLYDVQLYAETNMSNVDFYFTKDYFPQILAGTKENTSLIVTSYKTRGKYDIVIRAESKEPEFNDTAKLMMATIEAGEYNETQINTKIASTKDLINDNQECIEFSEMVRMAESYVASGNVEKANQILDSAVESCKYLITNDQILRESPMPQRTMREENPLMFFGVVLMIAIIVLLVILYYTKFSTKK